MQESRFEWTVEPAPYAAFILSVLILTIPLTWMISWICSVAVHELGHLIMLRCLGIPIYRIQLSLTGARIHTAPMEDAQEILCAAAGPIIGGILIFMGKWFPMVAFFSFFHTVWNLIPLREHDGRRILDALWKLVRKIPCKEGKERLQ